MRAVEDPIEYHDYDDDKHEGDHLTRERVVLHLAREAVVIHGDHFVVEDENVEDGHYLGRRDEDIEVFPWLLLRNQWEQTVEEA